MPYFKTSDNVAIHYNDWGAGKPIVLIHGWPLDGDMFEYQSVRLAESGFRVITYDRRGFGRSEQPWNGYDYGRLAQDLAELLDHLDVTGVTIAGFSMGGGEVARYVGGMGGPRAAKAIFISSVAPYMLQTPDNPDGVEQGVFDQMIDGLREDRPAFLADFGETFFGVGMLSSPVSDEMLEWSLDVAMLASPRATIECVKAFARTDFRADVAAVRVPTLVIHGSSDSTVPPAMGEATHRAIAGSTLKIYDGAPHGLFATHANDLFDDLAGFG